MAHYVLRIVQERLVDETDGAPVESLAPEALRPLEQSCARLLLLRVCDPVPDFREQHGAFSVHFKIFAICCTCPSAPDLSRG